MCLLPDGVNRERKEVVITLHERLATKHGLRETRPAHRHVPGKGVLLVEHLSDDRKDQAGRAPKPAAGFLAVDLPACLAERRVFAILRRFEQGAAERCLG